MLEIERKPPTDHELGYRPWDDVEVFGWDKKGERGDYMIHFTNNAPSTYFNVTEALEDGNITQKQHDCFILDDDYVGLDEYLISLINY